MFVRVLRRWLPFSIFLFCLAARAEMFTIHLKNGDRITGDILSEDSKQLKLSTPWQKELILPLDQIQSREKVTAPAVVASTNAAPAAVGAVAAAKPAQGGALPPANKPTWHFEAEAGLDVTRNATDRELYHGRLQAHYINGRFRNDLDYRVAYGKTDGQTSDDRMGGSIKSDFDLGQKRRFFAYNLLGADYDTVRKIDFEYEVGPGIGYRWFTGTNYVLNSEFGGSYQEQYLSDSTRRSDFRLRFEEDMTWRLSKRVTWDEKFEFMPSVDDWDNYRIRFESNLRFWLLSNLSLNATVLNIYDSRPAAGVVPNDLQIRSSIGVKF